MCTRQAKSADDALAIGERAGDVIPQPAPLGVRIDQRDQPRVDISGQGLCADVMHARPPGQLLCRVRETVPVFRVLLGPEPLGKRFISTDHVSRRRQHDGREFVHHLSRYLPEQFLCVRRPQRPIEGSTRLLRRDDPAVLERPLDEELDCTATLGFRASAEAIEQPPGQVERQGGRIDVAMERARDDKLVRVIGRQAQPLVEHVRGPVPHARSSRISASRRGRGKTSIMSRISGLYPFRLQTLKRSRACDCRDR